MISVIFGVFPLSEVEKIEVGFYRVVLARYLYLDGLEPLGDLRRGLSLKKNIFLLA